MTTADGEDKTSKILKCAARIANLWRKARAENSGQFVHWEAAALSPSDQALIEAAIVAAIAAEGVSQERIFSSTTEDLVIDDGPFVLVSVGAHMPLSDDLSNRMVAVHHLNSTWQPVMEEGSRGYKLPSMDGSVCLSGPFIHVVAHEEEDCG